jgi:hypothetical protein
MTGKKNLALPVLLLLAACLACQFGRVNQGRVISYEPDKQRIIVLAETNPVEPGAGRYLLPPATVALPQDRDEMGPAPSAGRLLLVDSADGSVLVFDDASAGLRRIPVSGLQQQRNVAAEDPRVLNTSFPVVNPSTRTITVYSVSDRTLHTFRVAQEHLALPPDTWKVGDDVRYYYKQPGQALRLMNVTKTDFSKGGH